MDRLVSCILSLLSNKWCGCECPPLDHRKLIVRDKDRMKNRIIAINEDSLAVSIGYQDKWDIIESRKVFHKMAVWYLLVWVWHDWFGVKSRIYWFCLKYVCENRRGLTNNRGE